MKRVLGSNAFKVAATLFVSAFFFYLFIRDLDLDQVWESIVDADYAWVPLGLLLFALSLVARTFRWRVFYMPGAPGMGILFQTMLITYAANNLLPLRGGELLRAQLLLDRAQVSRMRTLGVALIERFFDLAIVGVFIILGQFIVNVGIAFVGAGLIVALVGGVSLVVSALVASNKALPGKIASITWLPLKDSWRTKLRFWGEWMLDGFSVLRTPAGFLAASAWTMIAWGLEFGMYWAVARSFHIDEGFLTMAFVGAAASLSLSVPSAQGGVGPFQLVAKEALLKFGVSANVAGAYALALHVLLVVPVTIVGLLVFIFMVPRHRAVLRAATAETEGDAAGSASLVDRLVASDGEAEEQRDVHGEDYQRRREQGHNVAGDVVPNEHPEQQPRDHAVTHE
jgi:uncharacterized protein (TIRG00374 family)